MKNYVKNKNFIPIDYFEKINEKNNIVRKRLLDILILINIFIFPITISNLKNYKSESAVEVISIVEEPKNKENILTFIEEIDKDIIKLEIINGAGTMKIRNIDKIYNIEEANKIKIMSISKDKDKKYIVGVER
ncbi:hypothetical protein [Caproiciproducens sp. MSJ-32]|uniref:hypothetical protein n=1 Tax=Caproiciproducens sp. MSJ-32 TaxID=2841527 RepID=UPI001C102DF8|nr:hypothetical protein [Caproiciproducens sp. MSJ-32]MBU5454588.1 hypothetical protein [Caproiciproducens sp. MSJ-32]